MRSGDGSIGEFEAVVSALEEATRPLDDERAEKALDLFSRLRMHTHRLAESALWDRLNHSLSVCLHSSSEEVSRLAYHWLLMALGHEQGPPWADDDQRALRVARYRQKVTAIFPSLQSRVDCDDMLLKMTDDLAHCEGLCKCGPLDFFVAWLDELARERTSEDEPGPDAAAAAVIAYVHARRPWEEVRDLLLNALDHPHAMVRAYAARTIGNFYLGSMGKIAPKMSEMARLIAEKDIERPGIAGPFLSPFYTNMDVESFEAAVEVKLDDWIMDILCRRVGVEPNTLPCANGIDFFAHEVFGGREPYIRKLMELGNFDLVIEAATEYDFRIDELEPILVELGNHDDESICGPAVWHLARHYRHLHPRGQQLCIVELYEAKSGADVFVLHAPAPGREAVAATLYPVTDVFSDDAAWRAVDAIMPEEMRGPMIAHPAGVSHEAGVYILGNRALYAFAHGVLMKFYGDTEHKRWQRVSVQWRGAVGAWQPADLLTRGS